MKFIQITYVIKCTYLGDDEIDRIINADQIVFIDQRRRLIHLNDNIELNLTENSFNELMHFINVRGESKIVSNPEKDKFYNDVLDKYSASAMDRVAELMDR